jgi:hypothetical protein
VQKPALQILKQSIDNIGNRYASKIKRRKQEPGKGPEDGQHQ